MSAGDFRSWKLAAAASVVFASSAIGTLLWKEFKAKKKRPEKWVRVGTVENILIYPVKSFKGINVEEAKATNLGLQAVDSEYLRDRVFMVVNSKGELARAARYPRLVLIQASITDNQLTLTAPSIDPITIEIPLDVKEKRRSCKLYDEHVKNALDCGKAIGDWISTYLGTENFRLYYHASKNTQRTTLSSSQKRFMSFSPFDKGAFHDETSYMFCTTESLNELNTKLEEPITLAHFRPSIILSGTPEAFSEDFWTFVRIGTEDGPIFKSSQPCLRCNVTTIDPETGKSNLKGEPLLTLRRMKRSLGNESVDKICKNLAVFGLHLGLFEESDRNVKVGDPVYAAVL